MVPFGSSVPRGYTSYQLPRESCTRPISGTSSELGPPLGSSHRTKSKKSKSHHRSSCPTSISDEKFMGSQGKDGLFVSSADIRNKQTSVVPDKCPRDSNGRSLPLEASKLPSSGCTEVTDKRLCGGKRKRTKKPVESADCLPYKNGLLHSELKAHAATSNDDPSNKNRLSVTEGDMACHRRKHLAVSDKAPPFSFPSKVPSPGGGNDSAGNKFASLLSFEEMIKGNCLKLLDFDDDADEEKYRKAKERPLSPNLPVIRPRRNKGPTCAEPGSLGDRTLNCCPAFDSSLLHEDVPGNSDTGRLVLSGSSCAGHSNSILHFQHLSKEVPSKNSSHEICDRSSDSVLQANVGASETIVAKPNNLDSNSMLGHYCGSKRPPMHLVVSKRMKRSTMVNLFRYSEMLDSQSREHSKESSVDGPLLEKVSTDPLLSTE